MPQICHQHCPSDGFSLPGFAIGAAVVMAGGGMAISAVIGQLVLVAGITVSVLLVAFTWCLVHVLRRDRRHLSTRATIGEAVTQLAEPPRKSLPAARKAITGAYVITDAPVTREPARMPIKRDGTVTR